MGAMTQTKLAIFRMSGQYAAEWMRLREKGLVTGMDEAIAKPICDALPGCVTSEMFWPGGVYQMGHNGVFSTDKLSLAYTLTSVASLEFVRPFHENVQPVHMNHSLYSSKQEVPHNRLYHPVKCEAELFQAASAGLVSVGKHVSVSASVRGTRGHPSVVTSLGTCVCVCQKECAPLRAITLCLCLCLCLCTCVYVCMRECECQFVSKQSLHACACIHMRL